MTLILRTLSLVSAFLMIVFFVLPIMMLGYGTSPVRDAIASIVFVVVAVLAMRCTKWLWREKRFWTELRSLSEVSTLGSFIVLWPVEAFLEQQTIGLAKDLVHITTVLLVASVYFFVQRLGRRNSRAAATS